MCGKETAEMSQFLSNFHILEAFMLGMCRSQPISASVGCGFHVQNPSDADADLSDSFPREILTLHNWHVALLSSVSLVTKKSYTILRFLFILIK